MSEQVAVTDDGYPVFLMGPGDYADAYEAKAAELLREARIERER